MRSAYLYGCFLFGVSVFYIAPLLPNIPNIQKISIPKIHIPKIEIPKIYVPFIPAIPIIPLIPLIPKIPYIQPSPTNTTILQ